MALTLTQAKTLTPEQQRRVLELSKAWSKEQAIWLAEKLYNLNQQAIQQTTPAKTVAPTTTIQPATKIATAPIKPVTQAPAPIKPVTQAPTPIKPVTQAPTPATPKPTYNIKDFNPQQIQNMKDMKAQWKSDDEVRVVADRYLAIKKTPSLASTPSSISKQTTAPTMTASVMVPIQWTKFLIDKKRWEEIAKNVMEWIKNDPNLTSTRENFNAAYWYAQKPKEEQELLNRIWNIKVQPIVDKRNADIQKKAYEQLTSPETLTKTPEEIAKIEQSQLQAQNLKETAEQTRKLDEWLKIIQQNSDALNTLYGFDKDGAIDMNNKNSLAYNLQDYSNKYRAEKEKIFADFKSSQLNQIQGNMRASLASRWISPDNVSPEVLLSLSGSIGIEWLNNINKAREESVNNILAEEQNTMAKINALKEQGIINKNQARTAEEVLRSQVNDARTAIDRQWRSDLLWVAKWEVARKEAQKWDVVNAVTKFGESLWLSGASIWVLSSYLSWFSSPEIAVKQMVADLNNPNSELLKSVLAEEWKRKLWAEAEMALKLKLAEIAKWPWWYKPDAATSREVGSALWIPPANVTAEDSARYYTDPNLTQWVRSQKWLGEIPKTTQWK